MSLPHLTSHRRRSPCPRLCETFGSIVNCYGGQLLAPRPTPKLEDHPLSVVRDCLFNTVAWWRPLRHPLITEFNWHTEGCCSVASDAVLFGISCLKKLRGYRPVAAFITNQFQFWYEKRRWRYDEHSYIHTHTRYEHTYIHIHYYTGCILKYFD